METIIIAVIIMTVDVIGYAYKINSDESFGSYKLRRIPFIWFFWD